MERKKNHGVDYFILWLYKVIYIICKNIILYKY